MPVLSNFWAEGKKGVNVCTRNREGGVDKKGHMTLWRKEIRTVETMVRVTHRPSEDKLHGVALREMQIKATRRSHFRSSACQ